MKTNEPNDNVDSAFESLRQMAVPDGPSNALVNQTRDAIAREENKTANKPLWRTILMRARNPIAAMLLLSVGVFVAVVMLHSPGVTYADVIRRMSQAHLVRFDIVVNEALGRRFSVIDTDDGVEYDFIADTKTVRSHKQGQRNLFVDKKSKTAKLNLYPATETNAKTLLESFREMVDKPSKDLGPEEMLGHHAEKFVVEHPDNLEMTAVTNTSGNGMEVKLVVTPETFTLWADQQTGDLLHVEQVVGTGADARKSVYENFEIDPVISADDLSMDAPAGYALSISGQSLLSPAQMEKVVIQTLREYSASHAGNFPPDLTAFPESVAFLGAGKDLMAAAGRPQTRPTTRIVSSVGIHALVMMSSTAPSALTPESKAEPDSKIVWGWCYFAGKKMGDGAEQIFWYQADENGGHYRGIYSDLSSRDLTERPAH
jgi:hypothetical protein